MSFYAKLFIEGKEHTILECSFGISKESDATGKPSAIAKAGQIDMLIQLKERDKLFFRWARDPVMVKDGYIIFYKDNAIAEMDKLEFCSAYCLKFECDFHSEQSLVAQVTLSAHTVTFGGDTHENPWG